MANYYDKYLKDEQLLHIRIKNLLCEQPNCYFFHSADEGKRSKFEQYLFLKMCGNLKKLPDFICITPNNQYRGMVLEAKRETPFCKDGRLKAGEHLEKQQQTLMVFSEMGWLSTFVWDFFQAQNIIYNYFQDVK